MTPSPFEAAARAAIATRREPATRQDYVRALVRWLEHCAEQGIDPTAPTDGAAASFRDLVSINRKTGKPMRPSSIRNYFAALSYVYGTLIAKNPPKATWNPFSARNIQWPEVSTDEGETQPILDRDTQRILSVCAEDASPAGLRDHAIVQVLYGTGLRRMSVMSIERDRIVYQDDGQVIARVKVKGSGDNLKQVTLPESAVKAIEAWLEVAPKGPYVFPSRNKRGHMDLSMVNKILAARAKAAEVEEARPHKFRVAYATAAFDANLNQRDIQASMHHADPRSTQRYDRGNRGGEVAAAVAEHRAAAVAKRSR